MPRTSKKTSAATVEPAEEAVKSTVRKAAAKKKVEEIYLQLGDREWNLTDCKERAASAYAAEGHKPASIKKLAVYVKPEEGKVYYVVNDSENGSIDL